jgi:hypothetical protein
MADKALSNNVMRNNINTAADCLKKYIVHISNTKTNQRLSISVALK